MNYNPTNFHFVEKKPDKEMIGEAIPEPPKYKFHLAPHCWTPPTPSQECTYDNFIESFRTMPKDYRIFLDTGFVTSHEVPQELWDCIVDKHIFITEDVWKELQPWVANPFYNRWFRDYLCDSIEQEKSGKGHRRLSLSSFADLLPEHAKVARYYVNLLWLRKFVGINHAHEYAKHLGRTPTAEENQAELQAILGPRGWRLAKKALANPESLKINTDEALVVSAALRAVLFGQHSIVLTRDTDVFEQFYKAMYLIDTHYIAMLVAEEYHRAPSSYTTQPLPLGIDLYEGEGNLAIDFADDRDHYRRRSMACSPIQYSCCLLSTSDKPLIHSQRSFGVAPDMARIIEMKTKTNGRNTDLFGSMNLHIKLDPRKRFFERTGPALLNDRSLQGIADNEIPISAVDSDFAIFTDEGFMRTLPPPEDRGDD